MKALLLIILMSWPLVAIGGKADNLPEIFQPLTFSMDANEARLKFPNAEVQEIEYIGGHSVVVSNIKWEGLDDVVINVVQNNGRGLVPRFVRITTIETREVCYEDKVKATDCRNAYGKLLVNTFDSIKRRVEKECGPSAIFAKKGSRRLVTWACGPTRVSLSMGPGEEDADWAVELTAQPISLQG